jgi:hypothetical protein
MSKDRKTSKASAVDGEQQILDAFVESREDWRLALAAHRLAPPDTGFAGRLKGLAEAAERQASAFSAAALDYEWGPYEPEDIEPGDTEPEDTQADKPPYELQPNTGRRGPHRLWQNFDNAVAQLNQATLGHDMLAVANAYGDLAEAAAHLAKAVEAEDVVSIPRARRSA